MSSSKWRISMNYYQMSKILVCGGHSFVGKGLCGLLNLHNWSVDVFSRGKETRIENVIFGNYFTMLHNPFLYGDYDIVINLAVIKDGTVNNNIDYIRSLVEFCKMHHVKKLIHFSSIMVYNYQLKDIDEDTPIETLENTRKKGYGEFKIAVDQYLYSERETLPFELILVRPGYVLGDNRPCPFIKKLPFGITVIKGDKHSKQPIIQRESIHNAIIQIIGIEKNRFVYHLFPNNGMTKYEYAKQAGGYVLSLPKFLFDGIPAILCKIGIMPKSLYSRFEGMYIESNFSSKQTEEMLNLKF